MLWNASAMKGYPIKATDGYIGTISDLLYQDIDLAIRWAVVDTGDWLSGRRVLLPAAVLGEPDPEAHHLPVTLTMRQVADSHDVDVIQKRSEASAQPADDLPHGRSSFISGLDAVSSSDGAVDPNMQRGGTRVSSLSEITGGAIEATDGDIGHAEDFLVDPHGWQVHYLVVHTSNWWPGEKVLVSPQSITAIDWTRMIAHLDVTRKTVKDSPHYVAGDTVDGAFEEKFHSYYGLRGPQR